LLSKKKFTKTPASYFGSRRCSIFWTYFFFVLCSTFCENNHDIYCSIFSCTPFGQSWSTTSENNGDRHKAGTIEREFASSWAFLSLLYLHGSWISCQEADGSWWWPKYSCSLRYRYVWIVSNMYLVGIAHESIASN
jgi:hypothetical protein